MTALAAIHVGLKQLGIDGDDARDLYERQTGKRSLRKMSPGEHEAVIGELRRLGFKQASNGKRKRLEGRFAKKLQAQWIAAWNLGLVRDRDDVALLTFVKRQTGIEHARFLHHAEDARKAIEALKDWMARDAGVDWRHNRFLPGWTQAHGYRIASAQFRLLRRIDPAIADVVELDQWVVHHVDSAFRSWEADDRRWIAVMNALGDRIRSAKAS